MFKDALKLVKKERKQIYLVFVLVIFFGVIGYNIPNVMEEQQLQIIENIKGLVEGKSVFEMIWFIILNNIRASFIAIIFGVFGMGIFAIIFNGYFGGAVMSRAAIEEGIFVFWKLVPHGIFEIPAMCITYWFGIKIMLNVFNGTVKENYKEALSVWVYIVVPLLIIAGIIEGVLAFYLGVGK